MIGDKLYDIHRTAFGLEPEPRDFGVDKDSVIVRSKSDEILYTLTLGDSHIQKRGSTALCQWRTGIDKELIQLDLAQLNLDEDNPAEDFVACNMLLDVHELAHWADEHHFDNEHYEADTHSETWNEFILSEILAKQ